jgi:hypothetical protein
LFGEKPTGGKVELLIERVLGGNQVAAHMRVSKKPEVGATIRLSRRPPPPPPPPPLRTPSATKRSLPSTPARWQRPRPRCILTKLCWTSSPTWGCSRPM